MTNKILLTFIIISTIFSHAFAQRTCGFKAPTYSDAVFYKYSNENNTDQINIVTQEVSVCKRKYVIPVVVHVFMSDGETALNQSKVEAILNQANKEFQGLNSNYDDVDPRFKPIRGALDISFVLAKKDENGDSTNGINYYSTVNNLGDGGLAERRIIREHTWDPYKYLNIFIMRQISSDDLGGLGQFPSVYQSDTRLDNIMLKYTDASFVISHELGHWLSLYHTFEGGCGIAPLSDRVDDTPATGQAVSCEHGARFCAHYINGENHMDYTFCNRMFTKGQVERMRVALDYHPARKTLWTSENLKFTGLEEHDQDTVLVAEMVMSNNSIEVGQYIQFLDISCGQPTDRLWSIGGAEIDTSRIIDPVRQFKKAGNFEVTLEVTNAGGKRSIIKKNIEVVEPSKQCVVSYDFETEATGRDLSGWTQKSKRVRWFVLGDKDMYDGKESFTTEAFRSTASLTSDRQFIGDGDTSWLISPWIDFSQHVNMELQYRDMRCWDFVYPKLKYDHSVDILIRTASDTVFKVLHTDKANYADYKSWRQIQNINLKNYGRDTIQIAFRTTTDHYYWRIDDICFSGAPLVSIPKLQVSKIEVKPNPTSGVIDILVGDQEVSTQSIRILNIEGQVVLETNKLTVDVHDLTNGLYVVEWTNNQGTVGVTKFIKM